ncbi:hypothetical protein LB505_013869 [Fusarium chuoi]|nr:hypothetical protein LB505_013869 [Fusarium chuoi]
MPAPYSGKCLCGNYCHASVNIAVSGLVALINWYKIFIDALLTWKLTCTSQIGKFIAEDVKVSTTAEDAITKYSLSDTSSGSSKEKAFCRTCGCTLWTIPAAAKGKFYMIRLPLLEQG